MQSSSLPCPACESGETRIRFDKDGYDIHACRDCGLHFVFPIPDFAEIKEIYTGDYFNRGGKYSGLKQANETDPNYVNNQGKMSFLRKHLAGGRLLDVGCAQGEFVSLALQSGFQAEGVELSGDAARIAREKFKVTVHNCTLPEAGLPAASFDVITMWDVIEHLDHPLPTLSEARRLLKDRGSLILTTGDISSLWARISRRHWQLMTPPHHLYFHTPKSLQALLKRSGFEMKAVAYHGKKAYLDFIMFKATESFGQWMKPLHKAVSAMRLNRAAVNVNLFDIMTVTAERNG